ncbi:MAG: iron-sulfur cluster assembly accessory protein, partial [candidate division NC10 bacterium]|nr:iron-sulfur cluster assembly accessory protein [candidate division NC10 bacterium]
GGCSGFQYQLAFDNAKPGDKVFEHDGVKILVDQKSYLFLNDSEVDYTDSLYGAGFAIKNPNAKSTCGCGQSFSA